mmetsp:Transcript_46587/g.110779  ORF Transcript_46587/g.110779 Transcript_46587/m.110779 type:complete len:393 (-) Transcript_46587:82-1260(-)
MCEALCRGLQKTYAAFDAVTQTTSDVNELAEAIRGLRDRVLPMWPIVESIAKTAAVTKDTEMHLPLLMVKKQFDKLTTCIEGAHGPCSSEPQAPDTQACTAQQAREERQRLFTRLADMLHSRVQALKLANDIQGAGDKAANIVGAPMQTNMDTVAPFAADGTGSASMSSKRSTKVELTSKMNEILQEDLADSRDSHVIYRLRYVPLPGGVGGRSSFGLVVKQRPFFFMIEQDGVSVKYALLFPLRSPGEFISPLLMGVAGGTDELSSVGSRVQAYVEYTAARHPEYQALIQTYLDLPLKSVNGGKGIVHQTDAARKWQAVGGMCCAMSLLPCLWPVSCPCMCGAYYMAGVKTNTAYTFDTPDGPMDIYVHMAKVNDDPDNNGGASGIIVNKR